MSPPIRFAEEKQSNTVRQIVADHEPIAQRTWTPSQAVFARSAGTFHWTPEGRRLFDFSSGVLVANLGHNPRRWMQHFARYMKWSPEFLFGEESTDADYFPAVTLTAYNAVTELETQAVQRLLANIRSSRGGNRLDTIVWAASGSEAIQKALWGCLSRDTSRDMIIATRFGFHGKKGLANAVTGSEKDTERDSRVKFISFPQEEILDAGFDADAVNLAKYRAELDQLQTQFGR